MSQSDWTCLPTSGLQVVVLEEPEVLQSNPSWTVVLCQLCSNKRLVTLRWFRKNGKPFPSILNQSNLSWEMLEVSGDYIIHTFIDNGNPVQRMSVIATEVKVYSSDEPIDDGCEIRVTTDEEERSQRDLRNYVKYLRKKIALDSMKEKLKRTRPSDPVTEMLTEKLEKLQVSSGISNGTLKTQKSPASVQVHPVDDHSVPKKSLKSGSVVEKWKIFEEKSGWISKSNASTLSTNSKCYIIISKVKRVRRFLNWCDTFMLSNSFARLNI